MGSVLSRYALNFKENYLEEHVGLLWDNAQQFLFGEKPVLTDELLEVLYEDDGSNYEIEKVWGVVTKLRQDQLIAVINNVIYMDLSIPIPGGKTLRLGDHVFCTIYRRHEEDAWRVEKIEMIERNRTQKGTMEDDLCSWDQDSSLAFFGSAEDAPDTNDLLNMKPQTIVAQITSIDEELSLDNGKMKIPASACKEATYAVGDWLNIRVLVDPEEPNQKPTVVAVVPLRKWQAEGRINIVEGSTGVIDNDIYFNESACQNR